MHQPLSRPEPLARARDLRSRSLASTALIEALIRQQRVDEAAAIAREDLKALRALKGPVATEVLFYVAAAEALLAAGDRPEAERALRDAIRQIDRRARKITEPEAKQTDLTGRPENRRAFELAKAWFDK